MTGSRRLDCEEIAQVTWRRRQEDTTYKIADIALVVESLYVVEDNDAQNLKYATGYSQVLFNIELNLNYSNSVLNYRVLCVAVSCRILFVR